MSTPAPPYGAAQGLMDRYHQVLQFLGLQPHPAPAPVAPADTSGHDQMVRQANQSFVDADNARRAQPKVHEMTKPLGK